MKTPLKVFLFLFITLVLWFTLALIYVVLLKSLLGGTIIEWFIIGGGGYYSVLLSKKWVFDNKTFRIRPLFTTSPFLRKFWPLILVIGLLLLVGIWYRFWGPGEFNSKSLKAYNTVTAALFELKRDPDSFEATMSAAVGYFNLYNLNKSEEYYLKATVIDPTLALPWNNLGNTYRELLRYDEAEDAYEKSISLEPTAATSYLNLIDLYSRWDIEDYNRRSKIPKVFEQSLENTNRNIVILRALVDYYEGIGNPEEAQKYREEIELRDIDDENPPQKT